MMTFPQSAWDKVKAHLEDEKARINTAIGNYPTPITGCDQQFNYLLEQQTKIRAESTRLNKAMAHSDSSTDKALLERIDTFLQSSEFIDVDTAQMIRDGFEDQLPSRIK